MITKDDIYTEEFWQRSDLNLKDIILLDKKKANWNNVTPKGYTPLNLALMGTVTEDIVEFVLDKTDNKTINTVVPSYSNWNCLFFCLRFDRSVTLFRKLIEKGANYKQADEDGDTVLVLARKNKAVLNYLLETDDGFLRDHENKTSEALQNAICHINDMEIFELLLKFGAKPDHLNEDGENLLFSALHWGNISATRFLLKHGNKELFNKPNNAGETIYDCLKKAKNNKAIQVIRELIEKELTKTPDAELQLYNQDCITHFDIDENLSDFKLAKEHIEEDKDTNHYLKNSLYTLNGVLEQKEDEYAPVKQIHIETRELLLEFEATRTFGKVNAESTLKNFAFALRYRGVDFKPSDIIIKEESAQGIPGFEAILEHRDEIFFFRLLNVKKYVQIFALVHSRQELSEIQHLAHNLKITTQIPQETSSVKQETPTWENLPAYISQFPFAEKDSITLTVEGKEIKGSLYISDEEANFDRKRVKTLVAACISHKESIEKKLYNFAIECFEAVDWDLEEQIPLITNDPQILNADEKTQFLYLMNITGAKDIIALHDDISFYINIDNKEQYEINVTFYSEWEEEHGCVFNLKEGEELECESLNY